jgi:cobalamin biosynthesis protein CobT
VKHVLKPLSYSEGIGLLNHELNGLRIMNDVEQFVQNAIEISSQPNTDGQNVEEVVGDLMNMVTNFGFNLLYDAALHSSGSEQNMDQEWIIQMYDDANSDNSGTTNDNNSDSDSDSESNDGDDTGSDDGDDADSDHDDEDDSKSESESNENKKIMLPEVPESMLY